MSRTHHPRIPGTHRAMTRAYRHDLDWEGENCKPATAKRTAIIEGLAEAGVTGITVAAQLNLEAPAMTRECVDSLADFDVTHEGRMRVLMEALREMFPETGAFGGEILSDWEYDLMDLEASTGVSFGEYETEWMRNQDDEPEVVWSSDYDSDAVNEAEYERQRMEEAEYDEDFDGYSEDGCWLPLVALYDPTGATEDCYDVFGGDGFIVEGPTRSSRPEGRKQDRDEWTVTSLARAWDVETIVMLDALASVLGQDGLTHSSRIPMHVISEQASAERFVPEYRITRMSLFASMMLGYTDAPNNVRLGYGPRRPDAKQRRGIQRHEADKAWAARLDRTTQARIEARNPWGQPVERFRPVQRPGAPRPGNNPFLGRR